MFLSDVSLFLSPEIHNDEKLRSDLQRLNHETKIIEAKTESEVNGWFKQNITLSIVSKGYSLGCVKVVPLICFSS